MWSGRLMSMDMSFAMLLMRLKAFDISTLAHAFSDRFLAPAISSSNLPRSRPRLRVPRPSTRYHRPQPDISCPFAVNVLHVQPIEPVCRPRARELPLYALASSPSSTPLMLAPLVHSCQRRACDSPACPPCRHSQAVCIGRWRAPSVARPRSHSLPEKRRHSRPAETTVYHNLVGVRGSTRALLLPLDRTSSVPHSRPVTRPSSLRLPVKALSVSPIINFSGPCLRPTSALLCGKTRVLSTHNPLLHSPTSPDLPLPRLHPTSLWGPPRTLDPNLCSISLELSPLNLLYMSRWLYRLSHRCCTPS
ncbi:hypothetical protein C8Q80DRAFT_402955 [Daedaleopsis nitida]|nr:hypothetical protein C8Q80DRAFT_402955 [Daedaleopsis nitida]